MDKKAPTKAQQQMVEAWKQESEVMPECDEDTDTEGGLLRELLLARQRSGLTQAEVAEKMGTKPPAVTRLETALSDQRHSPTIATLKKYAQAVGCKLEVHLILSKTTKAPLGIAVALLSNLT